MMQDQATTTAIAEAKEVDKPVVTSASTPDVARRALLFSVAFLLLNFAEEGLKIVDLPAEWALATTTLATGVIFALRQFFLLSQQMGKQT